jgi:hypothetical protein
MLTANMPIAEMTDRLSGLVRACMVVFAKLGSATVRPLDWIFGGIFGELVREKDWRIALAVSLG